MGKIRYCQSCGMPLRNDGKFYGTNFDGSPNKEYCIYCFKNGKFTYTAAMEDMIDFQMPQMLPLYPGLPPEEVRKQMHEFYPTLKRWSSQKRALLPK